MPANMDTPIFKRLWTSNFSYCEDQRYLQTGLTSETKHGFIAHADPRKSKPVGPSKPAEFHHKDDEKIYERLPETRRQYFAKTPKVTIKSVEDEKAYKALFKTNWKVHKDDRINAFRTLNKESFYSKPYSRPNYKPHYCPPCIPFGDPEKVVERTSETTGAYQARNFSDRP